MTFPLVFQLFTFLETLWEASCETRFEYKASGWGNWTFNASEYDFLSRFASNFSCCMWTRMEREWKWKERLENSILQVARYAFFKKFDRYNFWFNNRSTRSKSKRNCLHKQNFLRYFLLINDPNKSFQDKCIWFWN